MMTEHTHQDSMLKGYASCASLPEIPVRVALHHMSIDATCGDPVTSPDPVKLWKQGIKLWADGSPWNGTIASSFPYLDTARVRNAQIPLGPRGEGMMEYTRAELDQVLATTHPRDSSSPSMSMATWASTSSSMPTSTPWLRTTSSAPIIAGAWSTWMGAEATSSTMPLRWA